MWNSCLWTENDTNLRKMYLNKVFYFILLMLFLSLPESLGSGRERPSFHFRVSHRHPSPGDQQEPSGRSTSANTSSPVKKDGARSETAVGTWAVTPQSPLPSPARLSSRHRLLAESSRGPTAPLWRLCPISCSGSRTPPVARTASSPKAWRGLCWYFLISHGGCESDSRTSTSSPPWCLMSDYR